MSVASCTATCKHGDVRACRDRLRQLKGLRALDAAADLLGLSLPPNTVEPEPSAAIDRPRMERIDGDVTRVSPMPATRPTSARSSELLFLLRHGFKDDCSLFERDATARASL